MMAVAVDHQAHVVKLSSSRPPRWKRKSSFTQADYQKMFDFSQSELAQTLMYIHKSLSTPCLLSDPSVLMEDYIGIEIVAGRAAPQVHNMVVQVALAMASGVDPEPVPTGLGGAYFFRARNGDTIAVAKPVDEEPLALNNPKGIVGRRLGEPGIKSSIRLGETGFRELAAYLLDHRGFSGVPATGLVKFSHANFNFNDSESSNSTTSRHKIASLQHFVEHDSDAADLGPSSFSVSSVQHIGILDVRLMNLDRHAGNILVRLGEENYGGGKAELVPIDHGFCLPEALEDPYFEWLHWPQASLPFSDTEIDYISSLDPYKDADILRRELPSIRESSIRVLIVCTLFLKQATAHGLCLAEIGGMMTRDFKRGKEIRSSLETLCIDAKQGSVDECGQNVSFGDMDNEKWLSFLDTFDKLLPKAFEDRKCSIRHG